MRSRYSCCDQKSIHSWKKILHFCINCRSILGLLSACTLGGSDHADKEQSQTARNDTGIATPHPAAKQLYFGDLHVRTAVSLDAFLWGNRHGVEDAYRFAKGEPITLTSGAVAQIASHWTLSPSQITPALLKLMHSAMQTIDGDFMRMKI